MTGLLYTLPAALRRAMEGGDGVLSPDDLLANPMAGCIRVEPQKDGGRRLVCDVDDVRHVSCLLDVHGRLVSMDDGHPTGQLSVEYEYDAFGLRRETLVRFLGENLVQSLHAEFEYGPDGQRQSVVVTEMGGRVVEEQSFGPGGRLDERRTFNDIGHDSCRERFHYDALGRLDSSHRQRFAATEPWQPVRDWTETHEYYPQTGYLARSILVERENDAATDDPPAWTPVTVEVIDFDPEQDGVPLRDEVQYLDRGPFGDPVLCKRILMHCRMIDPEGREATQVIEEDLGSGEVRERWCRCD